jgi:hypothetical protein
MRLYLLTGAALTMLAGFSGTAMAAPAQTAKQVPVFEVDANFPTMPDHRLLGGVGGATADSHGNVWCSTARTRWKKATPPRTATSQRRP